MQPSAAPGWFLEPQHVSILPPTAAHTLYSSASPPVFLPPHAHAPTDDRSPQGTSCSAEEEPEVSCSLPLFESVVLESAVIPRERQQPRKRAQHGRSGPRTSAAGHAQGSSEPQGTPASGISYENGSGDEEAPADVLMCTGGLVWSTAFCPAKVNLHASTTHQQHHAQQSQRAPQHSQEQQQPQQQAQQVQQSRGRKRKAAQPPQQQQQQQEQQDEALETSIPDNAAALGAAGSSGSEEMLAVAVHPKGVTRTRQGAILEGRGGVQLWAIPARGVATSTKRRSNSQASAAAASEGSEQGSAAPRMLACLMHQGLVTWDLQWCMEPHRVLSPSSTTHGQNQQAVPVAGVLAMLLGDGSVQVVSVPEAQYLDSLLLQQQQQQQHKPQQHTGTELAQEAQQEQQHHHHHHHYNDPQQDAGNRGAQGQTQQEQQQQQQQQHQQQKQQQQQYQVQALALSIKPHVTISRELLGGSAAASVAWRHGSLPGLVVGCWDGSVCVLSLPRTAAQPLQSLDIQFAVRPDTQPVRRVLWHPIPHSAKPSLSLNGAAHAHSPEALRAEGLGECTSSSLDQKADYTFLAVSQGGVFRVWDVRDAVCAILPRLLTRNATYDAAWVTGPGPNRYSIHFALDDGMLRSVELCPQFFLANAKANTTQFAAGYDPACIWSVDYSPITTALAYGGDDGIVVVSAAELCSDPRSRRPHVPVGGLVSDAGVLRVAGPRQLAGVPCVYGGGSHFGGERGAMGGTKAPGKGSTPAASSALRDSVQTLHSVRWSPNTQGSSLGPSSEGCKCATQAAWLAYGGAAGLVRCQRLALQL